MKESLEQPSPLEDVDSFTSGSTNTVDVIDEKIDFQEMTAIVEKVDNEWKGSLINTFKGISVRIDPKLIDFGYYISVSTELFNELKAQRNKER